MRAESWLLALCGGCAFSGAPAEAPSEADVLVHLIEAHAAPGAFVLVPPADVADTTTFGSSPYLGVGGALAARGLDGDAIVGTGVDAAGSPVLDVLQPDGTIVQGQGPSGIFRTARVDGVVVIWPCDGSAVRLVSGAVVEVPAPGACPEEIRDAGDGTLLTASASDAGFDVGRFAVTADGLRDLGTTVLPRSGPMDVVTVGEDARGLYVVANGAALVHVTEGGDMYGTGYVGVPYNLVRDGDAWLIGLFGPALTRWDPFADTTVQLGPAPVSGEYQQAPDLAGTIVGALTESEEIPSGSYLSAAWWATPTPSGYVADAIPPDPCADPAYGLQIGEWTVLAVTDAWVAYSVWSWLGPTAVVVAPRG